MRLIDAEKLPLEPKEANQFIPYEYASGWNDMLLNVLKAEQIDAVPVVRCKNCIHQTHDGNGFPYCLKLEMYLNKELDFFCLYGEREEGTL